MCLESCFPPKPSGMQTPKAPLNVAVIAMLLQPFSCPLTVPAGTYRQSAVAYRKA